MSDSNAWPELRLADWADTRDTLHMWLQIVGKIEMVSTALVNHWWNVSYEVSARGLRTRLMRDAGQQFDAEFDFVDHELVFRTTAGDRRSIALEPKTVSSFWAECLQALSTLSLDCTIVPRPNEVSPAVPFAEDTEHRSYDAAAANTYWRQLLCVDRVFSDWRAGFAGKDSPVQLFWGSMDLSCVRYSGRGAPPHTASTVNCPPWVMIEAESRENAAAGFWPGGPGEGTFYAYAYPEPDGYRAGEVRFGQFDSTLGEWVLTYEQVRTSSDPNATLLAFLDDTYARAADNGNWDRALLEVNPHRLDDQIHRRGQPVD